MKQEIYISTDIETDGPIPGQNSMLSFGSAAFEKSGKMINTFSANLEFLDGAKSNEKTMSEFWDKNPQAWKACRENVQPIKETMAKYVSWVHSLPGTPVFVGYPATFDFMFVYWYIIYSGLESPFSFSALDIKTYASAVLKSDFRKTTKRNMPSRWFSKDKHTHVALDDAIEQGKLFINILKENLK
jgi:DNA polymerase III alpha subunit (gram-positive type)